MISNPVYHDKLPRYIMKSYPVYHDKLPPYEKLPHEELTPYIYLYITLTNKLVRTI